MFETVLIVNVTHQCLTLFNISDTVHLSPAVSLNTKGGRPTIQGQKTAGATNKACNQFNF